MISVILTLLSLSGKLRRAHYQTALWCVVITLHNHYLYKCLYKTLSPERVWYFWELNLYSFADEGTDMATDYKLWPVDTLWMGCGLYWRAHNPLCLNFPAPSRGECDALLANLAGWNCWEVNGSCKFDLTTTKSFTHGDGFLMRDSSRPAHSNSGWKRCPTPSW